MYSLKNEFTIVLADNDILSKICGANDSNLKLIENYLGLPVFTHGNEISIPQENQDLCMEFKFIIDRLVDELSDCDSCPPELVESVLNTGRYKNFESEEFSPKEYSIKIPSGTRKIYPKTKNQALLIETFRKNSLVIATGPAGTGKTFLAVAESLNLLLSHKVNSIILTRPIVEAGENLGFLPGDLQDKINPYLRPLYDSINSCLPHDVSHRLQENGVIEVAPLAYMRGRSLDNAAVILDEAQNTTKEQMKMFLTRMGENSKVFITGDITQIDLPRRTPSGLVQALRILRNIPEIGIVKLTETDVVRSELVKKIIQAYENDETEQ